MEETCARADSVGTACYLHKLGPVVHFVDKTVGVVTEEVVADDVRMTTCPHSELPMVLV